MLLPPTPTAEHWRLQRSPFRSNLLSQNAPMPLATMGSNADVSMGRSSSGRGTGDRAQARWSILRDALLHRPKVPSEHSIHRFPGYQLIAPRRAGKEELAAFARLKTFQWNPDMGTHENEKRLEIHVLALSCCFPKGSCLEARALPMADKKAWLSSLKERCRPAVHVVLVEDDKAPDSLTLLVQQGNSASTYSACQYKLDETCSLWTREPKTNKLSLSDLVSHRTVGVDNTGNICVWDSERTLAYMLYHHLADFPKEIQQARSILELGTGMAGLAAVSLGLRVVQMKDAGNVKVTLTDGHGDGVKNNIVNQQLTAVACNDRNHPYHQLDVSSTTFLWTTGIANPLDLQDLQDVVLVSDCTHFQEYHAALATTILRSMKVGANAILCQPQRSDSLANFRRLVESTAVGEKLVSVSTWAHPVLAEQQAKAIENFGHAYEEDLHHPILLIVTKLRELKVTDCEAFVAVQANRATGGY